ncbi:PREDICTED: uncharacterized protein LOC102007567 [Chinchilla lanigera]|uniref:uncharacterized protein LOC102007567 n=1 Tax=Chinchilla lanigera TaxID=34839 RepID=UPI00038EA57E|nr:PREDICTED: uncharacterized protein LOC102007567 [Chinchilla lanigera]
MPGLPDAVMRFSFLCCMALCLLETGSVDAGVVQTPRYLIQVKGQQTTLRCSLISGHLSVSWYQQKLDQGPQFLFQYYNGEEREKGNNLDRFSVQQFKNSTAELTLRALELGDSALFLCASSVAQRCMVPNLLYKNISLQSGRDRESRSAGQPGSGPGKLTGLSQIFAAAAGMRDCLMLTELAPVKCHFTYLCICKKATFPELIFRSWLIPVPLTRVHPLTIHLADLSPPLTSPSQIQMNRKGMLCTAYDYYELLPDKSKKHTTSRPNVFMDPSL